jgi:hypothetical protein
MPNRQATTAPPGAATAERDSRDSIEAVAIDAHDHPVRTLDDVRLLNVSANSAAFTTRTAIRPGAIVRMTSRGPSAFPDAQATITLEVLEAKVHGNGRCWADCRRITGQLPADLIAPTHN